MATSPNQVPALLPEIDLDGLHRAVSGLTAEQLYWSSGYLAGLAQAAAPPAIAGAARPAAQPRTAPGITVLYGSQTGNGRGIATKLADTLGVAGAVARPVSMLEYRRKELKNEKHLIVVVSTHGEGDPPDDAEDFYEFLMGARAPGLPHLHYAVLALGDSSYERFCETGRRVDERLAELGARRLAARVDCDVDYDDDARLWSTAITTVIKEQLTDAAATSAVVTPLRAVPAAHDATSLYTKDRPLSAEVIGVQKITGRDSDKDVRHLEIDLGGKSLGYKAGDALGVIIHNRAALVDKVIGLLKLNADSAVAVGGHAGTLHNVLTTTRELTLPSRKVLQSWAAVAGNQDLAVLLTGATQSELSQLMATHQVVDILERYPARAAVSAQQLVDLLRPLTPRLYSIASSPLAYEDEVHLTVAVVNYDAFGEPHFGAASAFLGLELQAGDSVQVYLEPNSRFRLPDNHDAPVIMIGPGTGVAPFRAFLDERDAVGAAGKNWLFFGERTFAHDFLYQVEWQRHLKSGCLSRIDTAFSRDQAHKIYVQDRLRENGKDLFDWIQDGAYLYVCGDAKKMAPDVHATLLDVVREHGNMTPDAAVEYLKALRREGRYQKDVY